MDERDRDSILADLDSSDEEIRRLAVERLATLPPAEALPRLVDCLGDPGWRVRKAAVERLAQAPEAWPVADVLVDALADGENPGRRNAAVEALVRRGDSVVDALVGATHSADCDVRKLAVDTLTGIGASRATDRLLALLGDSDANVQAAAADALGVVGDEAVAGPLLEVATRRGDDRLVAFSALQALARLEVAVAATDLAPALEDGLLRPAAYAVLGCAAEADAGAVEALLKGVLSASRSSREAAMASLLRLVGRRDRDRAEELTQRIRETVAGETFSDAHERLSRGDLSTRLVLIQFLGMLRRPEAVAPIARAGADEALAEVALATLQSLGEVAEAAFDAAWGELEPEARRLACRVLASTDGPVGQTRLLAALDDPDAPLRTAAALALGRRRGADALAPLLRRLEAVAAQEDDVDSEDELGALTGALIELASGPEGGIRDQAVDLLSQRLDGAPEPVRLALAAVLGRIGRGSDHALVEWLLKDSSAGVRREAVQALARLDHGEASEPLRLALADESAGVRIAAARALGSSTSPQALMDLRRLADDEDPRVRAAALRAMGARAVCGDEDESEATLTRLEAALSDEGGVAMAALEALRALGTAQAGAAALALLGRDDPELVQAAVGCVGAHAERGQLDALLPLVAHPHWSVRAEAVQILADRSVVAAIPAILRRLETEQDDFVRDAILRALRKLEG